MRIVVTSYIFRKTEKKKKFLFNAQWTFSDLRIHNLPPASRVRREVVDLAPRWDFDAIYFLLLFNLFNNKNSEKTKLNIVHFLRF